MGDLELILHNLRALHTPFRRSRECHRKSVETIKSARQPLSMVVSAHCGAIAKT